jgi:ABC-type transport system substrate-binding protein
VPVPDLPHEAEAEFEAGYAAHPSWPDANVSHPYLGIQSISFPLYDPRYGDPKLRQAISMAIDRKFVVDTAFDGDKLLPDGLVPPSVPGYVSGQCGECYRFQPGSAAGARLTRVART